MAVGKPDCVKKVPTKAKIKVIRKGVFALGKEAQDD